MKRILITVALALIALTTIQSPVMAAGCRYDDAAAVATENATDAEIEAVARVVFAEARGGTIDDMAAVVYTIVNRASRPYMIVGGERVPCWWGYDILSVATKQYQYARYTGEIPAVSTVWDTVFQVSFDVLNGFYGPDTTGGATHYHNETVNPRWAQFMEQTAQIGAHTFYR